MINTNIAHYIITAKLGQGGMGEVYQATDMKLDREVAVKVLPKSFTSDQNRIARFEREAKTLAALNHPNIAIIYGVEQSVDAHALIMELVEGETLGERLKREPMTVEESLECCKQIADALEAAHEKGIIHRDLKPDNIKITQDGQVKVLDFGLAKALNDSSMSVVEDNLADSPTLTNLVTIPGQFLGTPPYMSPEQARAKPVDKRSDIWAFGCVLYECLTGKAMFEGEDVTETLASIIKGEPDWSALPEETPPTIELLLRKCLNKDPKRRLHDIADARIDLEQALSDPSSSIIQLSDMALKSTLKHTGKHKLLYVGIVIFIALITGSAGWFLKPAPPSNPPLTAIHSELILPGNKLGFLTISPDAKYLAFDINLEGDPIHLRFLDKNGIVDIEETENNWIMFFSPDSKSIGYISPGQIYRVGLDGSKPISISEHSGFQFNPGASWSESGEIVFPDGWGGGLMKADSIGGKAQILTQLKPGEKGHYWPQCLPGGKHVLFMILQDDPGSQRGRKVAIADLDTGNHHILPLEDNCIYPKYAESGHLLYVNNGILFAVPFDLNRLTITGSKKDVLQGIEMNSTLAFYDISKDGTLVYIAGDQKYNKKYTLKWLYKDGVEEIVTTIEGDVGRFDLSPDEKYVTYDIKDDNDQEDIWFIELDRKIPIRLTNNDAEDEWPFWSADGEWIYFRSDRENKSGLWKKRADSPESNAEFVMEHNDKKIWSCSVTRDGKHLTYTIFNKSGDIWTVRLDEENPSKRLLKDTSAHETWNAVSPDGKWLAYTSDSTGRMELYVVPFEDPDRQIRPISINGAGTIHWTANGDQLFYLDHSLIFGDSLPGSRIWSVEITDENDDIISSDPEEVLEITSSIKDWAVDGKGEKILILIEEKSSDIRNLGIDSDHNIVNVVTNFFTILNEKAPPKQPK